MRESQLRATTILASERRRGYPVLTFASERMASRWSCIALLPHPVGAFTAEWCELALQSSPTPSIASIGG